MTVDINDPRLSELRKDVEESFRGGAEWTSMRTTTALALLEVVEAARAVENWRSVESHFGEDTFSITTKLAANRLRLALVPFFPSYGDSA